jgi:hypothetical protein
MLESGQGDAGPDHIRSECMAEPVGIGGADLTAQSMMPEQRAESRRCHGLTTALTFERNEKMRGVGERPFQAEITPEGFQNLAGQWQDTLFPALAQNVQKRIGRFQIFELEGQDLTGTQAIQQHQTDHSKIAERAKAGPELGDLLCSERLDHPAGLPEAESEGDGAMGAAIAERAACRPFALEMGMDGRDLLPVMESVQTTNHRQAMIYGLWCRPGLLT